MLKQLVNFLFAIKLSSDFFTRFIQISKNLKKIKSSLFFALNRNHFVHRKGNNCKKKCQKGIILESNGLFITCTNHNPLTLK